MRVWQLQEAKAKLTQLMKNAQFEDQIISRHGVNEMVVMSIERYKKLTSKEESIVSFFRKSPLNGVDLDFSRDTSFMREIDL